MSERRTSRRLRVAAAAVGLALAPATAEAQRPAVEVDPELSFVVHRAIDVALEDPATAVETGDVVVPRDSLRSAPILQLGGSLVLEGRVDGGVVAVDAEVVLRPGASIGGDLTVIGGKLYGTRMAEVEGRRAWHRDEPVRVVAAGPGRLRVERIERPAGFPLETKGLLGFVVHEYNGVDGLLLGFSVGLASRPGKPRTELAGGPVFRTARDDVGWSVEGAREIPAARLAFGGRFERITDTGQRWQRSDLGNSVAAFLFSDDDRAYFERTGYALWVERSWGLPLALRLRWRDDDFDSLEGEEPYAVFDDDRWPTNPPVDEGRGRALGVAASFDRRDDPGFPTRGVYAEVGYDHWGFGGDFSFDQARAELRGWLPVGGRSFLAARAMAGGRLGDGRLAPQFLYRLGSGGSIVGYDALTEPLAGDRMALANLRLHLALPGAFGGMETIYVVGLADVGDAWFDAATREWNGGFGAGLAGTGPLRYLGVFGAYGTESEEWKAYLLVAPWF